MISAPQLLTMACLLAFPSDAGADRPPASPGLPLQADRTIEFTAEAGTWVSVDVAPDGKTIAFDLLGDIYAMPIEGGEARAIVAGLAFENQPRFSPDGRQIAYISDRSGGENLWVADADGSDPRQLSSTNKVKYISPSWTPDGESILVSRQDEPIAPPFVLWSYPARGGPGVKALDRKEDEGRQGFVLGAVAAGDGKHLFFARYARKAPEYNKMEPNPSQVVRRDRATGAEEEVADAPGGGFRPVLSPDGSRLAYGSRRDGQTGLRLRELATGEERWLRFPIQRDDQESVVSCDLLPGYDFTPDGRAIVAAYGGKIHRIDVATGADPVIPFRAPVRLPVGSRLDFPARIDEGPVRSRLIQGACPSPDGKRLAFSALTRLHVMDLPAGRPVQLTAEGERGYLPAWSPDGKWLAYVSWADGRGYIWKRPVDGSAPPVRLTAQAASYRDPAWSPDGTRVVALRAPRGAKAPSVDDAMQEQARMELIWVDAAGGEAHRVIPPEPVARPHFGPEPDRIYLRTADGLASVRFDGTDRRAALDVTRGSTDDLAGGPFVRSILVKPDGGWALTLCDDQVYLVRIRAGGDAPRIDLNAPDAPARRLSSIGADEVCWADGGRGIAWTTGASLFRVPFDAARAGIDEPAAGVAKPTRPERPRAEEVAVAVERPRAIPRGAVALRGAKVVTMRGDEVIAAGDVLVVDHRIAAVGPTGTVAIPDGARVIDLAGKVVVPGFIDTHPHWLEIRRRVLDLANWDFFATLAYGVTTGRDPATFTNDMFAYQDLVEAGDLVGPRAFSTGPALYANNDLRSPADALDLAARSKAYYRTNFLKCYMIGNRRQREWLVQACRQYRMMPTTEGAQNLNLDLTHVMDGFSGAEHALPVVGIEDDVVTLLARTRVAYTPTLVVSYGGPMGETHFRAGADIHDDPKARRFIPHEVIDASVRRTPWFHRDEHVYHQYAAAAARVVRAGGRVCVGSHGQMQGIGYHWEMWALADGGFRPMEVLRAATLHGAEAIGYAQDLGSLEPGKLADLVVLDEDPLADIRNTTAIRFVMKNGELYEGNTLDRIWPDARPLPPLPWWAEEAPPPAR